MAYIRNLFALPANTRTLFRKLENLAKKQIKNKWSIAFNDACIKENLLPNYTRINK